MRRTRSLCLSAVLVACETGGGAAGGVTDPGGTPHVPGDASGDTPPSAADTSPPSDAIPVHPTAPPPPGCNIPATCFRLDAGGPWTPDTGSLPDTGALPDAWADARADVDATRLADVDATRLADVDPRDAGPDSDISATGPDATPDAAARPDAGLLSSDGSSDASPDASADAVSPDAVVCPPRRPPAVILLIGDAMGPDHIAATRAWLGRPLVMETLPHHGHIVTSSLDGITDSGAASTAMSTGIHTVNHLIGLDREGREVEVAVELAHRAGASAGVVSTASVPHATPAGFAAHHINRFAYSAIADSMARIQPDVMLGGGRLYFWVS